MTDKNVVFSLLDGDFEGLKAGEVELRDMCQKIAADLEVDFIFYSAYRTDVDSGVVVISNCPPEWSEIYTSRGFAASDPVLKRVLKGEGLCRWDQIGELSEDEAEVMRVAAQYVGPHGCTMPLGSKPLLGTISVSSHCTKEEWVSRTPTIVWKLSSIGQKLHDITIKIQELRHDVKLSENQKHCLGLVASGCSIDRISLLVRTEKTTVQKHLYNAQRKLRAANLSQAVAKAAFLGEIHI